MTSVEHADGIQVAVYGAAIRVGQSPSGMRLPLAFGPASCQFDPPDQVRNQPRDPSLWLALAR